MKKAVKWLALFVMTVCLGAALAACGGKVAGVYECEMEMAKGTYKVDGDKITFTVEGESETMEATVKDGDIVMSQEGVSVTYKKK